MMRKAIVMVTLMVMQYEAIHSKPTTYTVGDEEGWNLVIDMQSWTRGKQFYAGDLLIFTYDTYRFDLALVNQDGHDSCYLNEGAQVFHTGNDTIQLVFGANYFIDSNRDICAARMKMAINATAPPSLI